MYKALVIISSDSAYTGAREDLSGPRARAMLEENGYEVTDVLVLPDDHRMIADALIGTCDRGEADLIVTSGGTGFAPRDVTPEATAEAVERMAPGIAEAIRAGSMKYTDRAMLSRGIAGIRKRTLIVNLPGSPKAVGEALGIILPAIGHGIAILKGEDGNCGR